MAAALLLCFALLPQSATTAAREDSWPCSCGASWSSSCLCRFAQRRSRGRFAWRGTMTAAASLRYRAVAACSKLLLIQILSGIAALVTLLRGKTRPLPLHLLTRPRPCQLCSRHSWGRAGCCSFARGSSTAAGASLGDEVCSLLFCPAVPPEHVSCCK